MLIEEQGSDTNRAPANGMMRTMKQIDGLICDSPFINKAFILHIDLRQPLYKQSIYFTQSTSQIGHIYKHTHVRLSFRCTVS